MRSLLAFIITVLIYIVLIWLYLISFHTINPIQKEPKIDNRINISLKEYYPPKKSIKNQIDIKPKKHKLMSKKKNIKTKIKKKLKKTKRIKKNHKKKLLKSNKLTHKKIKHKKAFSQSDIVYIPTPLFKESVTQYAPKLKEQKSYPNSKVKRLYGKEYFSYTPAQKKFIEQNLDEIHRITQEVLWQRGYPGGAISAKTGQQGTNIVSFYLYPNGDISNLRLKKRVGYRLLDKNTLETIKTAYKDYPYPTERTKIVFFVEYSIFGY